MFVRTCACTLCDSHWLDGDAGKRATRCDPCKLGLHPQRKKVAS